VTQPRPIPEDCSAARDAYAGYLASPERHAPVRAHLRACPDCRAAFARGLGCSDGDSGVHSVRLRREREQRRGQQRGMALAGAFQGWTGGPRGARLRLLLVPAAAIVLMTQLARGPRLSGEVRAQALSGSVWLEAQGLAASAAPRAVFLGEGCSTGSDGRARLESGSASVELAPHASAWLEARLPARFRLGAGNFTLHGDLTATTHWGVLECERGHAQVHLGPDGLDVQVREGVLRWIDSRGTRTLSAGDRASTR